MKLTMEFIHPQMSKKAVKEKKRALVKVQQQVEDKRKENYELEKRLKELQVCVLERKEIETLAGMYLFVYIRTYYILGVQQLCSPNAYDIRICTLYSQFVF